MELLLQFLLGSAELLVEAVEGPLQVETSLELIGTFRRTAPGGRT